MAITADYLMTDTEHRNPSDYTPELSRRGRGVDVWAGSPIPQGRIDSPATLLFISESYWHPWFPNKTAWTISGPSNPATGRQFPFRRHEGGFPLGFADGHSETAGVMEHDNTINEPPVGWDGPVYWPDVPDHYWLIGT